MFLKGLFTAALAAGLGVAQTDMADAAIYDITWTGGSGYTLEGRLTFDDSLLGTGAIDGTHIEDLVFEVFRNGVSMGAATLADFGGVFNLNFDTDAEQFVIGGLSSSPQGQLWNFSGSSVGFVSGLNSQTVYRNGSLLVGSDIPIADSTLTATRVEAAISLPASALLLLGGLGALGLVRRRSA